MISTAADSGSAAASGTLQVNIWDNNQLAGIQEIADEISRRVDEIMEL